MRRKFFLFPIIGLAFLAAGGAAVRFLWNAVLPQAWDGANELTYWQALGLLALCRLLFGGRFGGGPPWARRDGKWVGGPPWRRWHNLSQEEREKLRNRWKERRCGPADDENRPQG